MEKFQHPLIRRVHEIVSPRQPLYLVGGAVRDILLGKEIHDLDFVVPRKGLYWARQVANALQGAFYPLDETRDMGRVILSEEDGNRLVLDFSRQRGDSLEDDLRARDFTLNAIALDVHHPVELIDPLNGGIDLHHKRLRACSDGSLQEDPLRVLRGIRFAVSLGLAIDSATRMQMRQNAPDLARVSAERVCDELFHILDGHKVDVSLRVMDKIGALQVVLPEIDELREAEVSGQTLKARWEHALSTLHNLEVILDTLSPTANLDDGGNLWIGLLSLRLGRYRSDLAHHFSLSLNPQRSLLALLKLAAIYQCVNLPDLEKGGEIDTDVGALAAERGRQLRLSNGEIQRLHVVAGSRLMVKRLFEGEGEPGARDIYRFFRRTRAAGVEIILLALAGTLARYGARLARQTWDHDLAIARSLLEAWFEERGQVIDPPVLISGIDLREQFSLKPGPEFGRLLELVREAQAAGEIKEKKDALALIAQDLMHRT